MLSSFSLKAKIGLGLLVSYTSYAAFVSYAANSEITKRANIEKLRNQKNGVLKPEENHDHIEDKYASFTVAGRFENPFEEYRMQTLFEFFLTRILELFEGKGRGNVPSKTRLRELLPVNKPDFELLNESSSDHTTGSDLKEKFLPSFKDRLTFTWLGQSCAFVQISGLNILTDPIFSDYLVNSVLGPKRITPSPCELKELPKPNFILVSHNHPDHLDPETVDEIKNGSTWIVPLGVRKYLASKGIYNIIELNWWEKVRLPVSDNTDDIYEVACTPAMHWSGRHILDSNTTLWCSFVVLKNGKSIFYHAGDTGYVHDLFTKISEKYGEGTKLAMLPCGQYCPQWHQKPRHINPQECVNIMNDMKAKKVVGVHWGTFVLSSEHFLEPKLKLEELAKRLNKVHDIFAPDFGRTTVFDMSDNDDDDGSKYIPIRDGKSILVK